YQYRASYSNSVTSNVATTAATVTVNTGTSAPSITTQPTNQSATAGNTATFTAAATGTPTPTVKWQSNSGSGWADIGGATSDSYTTPALASGDNGTQYRAIYTNGVGSDATTNAATLTVNSAPSITTQPTSQSISDGATATFTAAATGNPTPTVQWQVNAGSGWTDVTDGTGGTTTSYTTAAMNLAASGYQYRARFTNSVTANVATSAAVLTVNSGSSSSSPSITSHPSGTTVIAGSLASFSAAATGSPTPTVKWQVNSGSGWTDISGATSPTYSFTSAAADNGRQYRAVFTNGVGSDATTNVATLTVQSAPSVTTQPTSQTVTAGATVTFSAAASGNPAPTVKWQSNSGSGWTDISGATSPTYSFTSVPGDNGRQYRAVFTNGVGSDATTNLATLTVQSAPSVTTQPTSQTVTAGATVTFNAAASGNPAPSVKWQVNSGSGWTDIVGATSTTYSFTAATTDDGHQFRAVFTNGIGSDATTTAATVLVPALTTFTVSKGQVQRSFLRYLDVGTNSSATASALAASGRVRLLMADLNGSGATVVPLTGFVSASGSTVAIDFGAAGLGAGRNTNMADGSCTLGLDLDGDGTFETSRRFYRLLGDVNGDRQVDDSDVSLVRAGTTSAYSSVLDTNGDGIVNASDLLYSTRAKGRKLAAGLLLD
ncbi:MAG: immunoglobulin domain-containing protein, partial [Planctomycetia bacterium]